MSRVQPGHLTHKSLWPSATSNCGGLRPRIGSPWTQECCGLWPPLAAKFHTCLGKWSLKFCHLLQTICFRAAQVLIVVRLWFSYYARVKTMSAERMLSWYHTRSIFMSLDLLTGLSQMPGENTLQSGNTSAILTSDPVMIT